MTKRTQRILENAKYMIKNSHDALHDDDCTKAIYERIVNTMTTNALLEVMSEKECEEIINELFFFTMKLVAETTE